MFILHINDDQYILREIFKQLINLPGDGQKVHNISLRGPHEIKDLACFAACVYLLDGLFGKLGRIVLHTTH